MSMSFKKKAIFTALLFFSFLLNLTHNVFCRTPDNLNQVILNFNQNTTPDEKLKLSYLALDLYAPLKKKSEVDPDDRVVLSSIKRIVLEDVMSKAGKDILVTAVGTTGYWVLKREDRIVNDYRAEDQEQIVQLKRKGCYMEGLSDLDFVIMGPNAAIYQGAIYRILAQGIGDIHLMPEELEKLEISFITDDQVRDLSPGPEGKNFWKQLMNLEATSPHPEKYITKGGKALYGMEHLFEEGAVAISNQGAAPGLFRDYALKSGHRMGPFILTHLFGGSCDMDFFISHALEKRGQERVKTVLQVMKYLKREEWMLRNASRNMNKLPDTIKKSPVTVKSLENYAADIAAFNQKAVDQKVWKSQEASMLFGKQAIELSGLICSFSHSCIIETGDELLTLRKKNKLTDETRELLSSIVFDLVTVDEERYLGKYPLWYARSDSGDQAIMPRDETLEFLIRYRQGENQDNWKGPVIAIPGEKKKKEMDTGPIIPPPVASIEIKNVKVSPEKPLAGAPVKFTVTGSIIGISKEMPDFSKNIYSAAEQKVMEELGLWSLRATLHRIQIQYLMEQDLLSKNAAKTSEKIYVSPYEIAEISEELLVPAEEEIARLSSELNYKVSEEKSGKYALRVRPVPSAQSIKDYIKAMEDTCKQSKMALDIINNLSYHISASLEMATDDNKTAIIVTDQDDYQTVWNEDGTYTGTNRYASRMEINRDSLAVKLAEFRENSRKGIYIVDKAIEYTEEAKKRVDQLEGIFQKDPSTASELAGELQEKLEELVDTTKLTIGSVQDFRLRLIDGITSAHLYVAKNSNPETEKRYRQKVASMVEEWKGREIELSDKILPDLEKKEIWLRRGAWAAKTAKWGFDALSYYQKYQEDKESLASTDLNAGLEDAVIALGLTGKAIEKVIELIPLKILESSLKSYSKLLSDATKWASAMDSLQALRYQDQDFEIRMAIPPAAYKALMAHDPDLEPGLFYRSRMPLAEYNGLTILAYPRPEPTETGSKKRDRMWFIWDKHSPDGYLPLDKDRFEKMSLYAAWYRRVNDKNISGEDLYNLLSKGKIEAGYIIKDIITPDKLKQEAATLLRLKALQAYFFSLTGKGKFEDEELYTYMSMLYHAGREFARNGFLLSDPDIKEIMEAVFYEKPISGNWKTVFDIFAMNSGSADRFNEGAANWDRLSGGEKERLQAFLDNFIKKKITERAEDRSKNWQQARTSEDSNVPVASGLLYSETGLVFNHAFFSGTGELYSDDYMDIREDNFTITWETLLPDNTDITEATYICIAEIAGYPNTRVQYALPMDTCENDILKQMLELAETAEEKGNLAWSTCQSASTGIDSFLERADELIIFLDELKKLNSDFIKIEQAASEAPSILRRKSSEAKGLYAKISKNIAEIETLKSQICENRGSTAPGVIEKQNRLLQQVRLLMVNIRAESQKLEILFKESEKSLTALKDFKNLIERSKRLFDENMSWIKGLSEGYLKSLANLTEVEKAIKELSVLKNKADKLLSDANRVYSDPDSASVLKDIKKAYDRVQQPINELNDCHRLVNDKKARSNNLFERLSNELKQSEMSFNQANKKWGIIEPEMEELAALGKAISDMWNTVQSQVIKAENNISEAEACTDEESHDQAKVPDVSGMNMASAKNSIKNAGFIAVFKGGNPAPSRELAYTAASQNPEPGKIANRGESVTIILYSDFSGYIIPDVKGLTSKEAFLKIEKAGFKAVMTGGDPAPDESLRFKVQSQEPSPGETAAQGTTIKIQIYGDLHYVNVPSLLSMTATEAKAAVVSAGLVPFLFGGDSAPKKSMSYRVQGQSPEPGTQVLHGSRVNIHVYGNFNVETALSGADCNHIYKSILVWDDQNERPGCACPPRMVLNNTGNACVDDPRIEQERIRRQQFWSTVVSTAVPIIINEMNAGANRGGGNQSGGNNQQTDSGTEPTPSTGNVPVIRPTPGTSTGTNRTGGGQDCEQKFCPMCPKSVGLLGQSPDPQCMECKQRRKNEIDQCYKGEQTGPGTRYIAKEYMTICYTRWDDYYKKDVCSNYEVVKVSAPINGRYQKIYGPDGWVECDFCLQKLIRGDRCDEIANE